MSKQSKQRKRRARTTMKSWLVALAVFVLIAAIPAWSFYTWVSTISFGDTRSLVIVKGASTQKQTVKPFEEPVLSITFDDGWESAYTTAFPLLEKYGMKTTQYVITSTFPKHNYMSVAQLRDMQLKGHEIASHTVTHPDLVAVTPADLNYELNDSKRSLDGLFGATLDFASPASSYNEAVLTAIKKTYSSHRNTNADLKIIGLDDLNIKETFNPYDIVAYSVRRTTTPDEISSFINAARNHNAWIILAYHQVDSTDEYFGVAKDVFEQHLQLIQRSGIKVVPVGQFMRAEERMSKK